MLKAFFTVVKNKKLDCFFLQATNSLTYHGGALSPPCLSIFSRVLVVYTLIVYASAIYIIDKHSSL
jgi:hypothetical protein